MPGKAYEIVIHKNSENEESLDITFHGRGYAYSIEISPTGDDPKEECAIDFASNLEEATGLRWRIHDESNGPFTVH